MVTWDRQASGWWSFLATQGRSPAEITVIIQDALGPRPGGPDQTDDTVALSSVEAPPASVPLDGPPAQLPPFQWGDRVPLPPPMSTALHIWPHPLGALPDTAPGAAALSSDPLLEGIDEPPASPQVESPIDLKATPRKPARRTRARKT